MGPGSVKPLPWGQNFTFYFTQKFSLKPSGKVIFLHRLLTESQRALGGWVLVLLGRLCKGGK